MPDAPHGIAAPRAMGQVLERGRVFAYSSGTFTSVSANPITVLTVPPGQAFYVDFLALTGFSNLITPEPLPVILYLGIDNIPTLALGPNTTTQPLTPARPFICTSSVYVHYFGRIEVSISVNFLITYAGDVHG